MSFTLTPTKKSCLKRISLFLFMLLLLAIASLIGVKYIGTYYAKQTLEKEIQASGMKPLIHYQGVTFNPFTLTPSIHHVSLGNEHYPWIRFDAIHFHYLPIIYPALNVTFEFAQDTTKPLSRDTRYVMKRAGLNQLIGNGTLISHPDKNNLQSELILNIKGAGKIRFTSNLDILSPDFSLHELRSDILASMAMGQLEAIPILYSDSLAFHSVSLDFQNHGLIEHIWPNHLRDTPNIAQAYLLALIDQYGLASYQSPEAGKISRQLLSFWDHPQSIDLQMHPNRAMKLGSLMTSIQKKTLFQDTKMHITTQPTN